VVHLSSATVDGFIVLQVLIGLAAFASPRSRLVAGCIGSLVCCAFWIIGPGFSQLLSGHATDPNTAPLVVVLAVALAGRRKDTPDPVQHPRGWRARSSTVQRPLGRVRVRR
jgi:hypothetical protein